MKDNRLSNLQKVHYHEIPSIYHRDKIVKVTHGLHVILTYKHKNELRFHKIFISSSFETNLYKYSIYPNDLTKYDLLAFHIFRYVNERCNFSKQNWKILWKSLRQSNTLFSSIKKFYYFIKHYTI